MRPPLPRCSPSRSSRIPTAGGPRRCSSTGSRAATAGESSLDPVRSQYREFFITVNATYEGEEVAYCPYIWVDRDFALARGWIQGFPKKLGSVWITRTFGLETTADPGLRAGSRVRRHLRGERPPARGRDRDPPPAERRGPDPQRPADRERAPSAAPRRGSPRRPRRARAGPLASAMTARGRRSGRATRRSSSSRRPTRSTRRSRRCASARAFASRWATRSTTSRRWWSCERARDERVGGRGRRGGGQHGPLDRRRAGRVAASASTT